MPSTYTTNGGIELPANGEQSGTWGETVNDNMAIIDRLTNGVGEISLSGTTHTLTTTDGTLSDGQYNVLVLGGSPSGTNTITISPNDGEHVYIVKNASGQTATFTQGSGANVSVINNTTKIIYADGAGAGAAVVDITGALDLGSLIIAGTSVTATAAELNLLDGSIAGTVVNSKAVIYGAAGQVEATTVEFDNLSGTGAVSVTNILDEDNMASDSATALATQQSIKAYVDAQVGTVDTLAEILAIGNTTGATDIAVDSAQKVQFRDAAIYINSSVDGQLDIVADTEIQIAATTVDLNGNLDVSGTALVTGVLTTTAATVSNGGGQFNGAINVGVDDTGYDVKFFGATTGKSLLWDESADSLIVTGTTTLVGTTNLDAVDIDGATQIDATVTVGVDDTGYDVKFFGATAGAYMLWDESADTLEVSGTITVDGLTVDGSVSITDAVNAKLSLSGPISSIDMYDTSSVNSNTRFESHSNGLFIKSLNDDGTATQYIIELNCSNGNIIFFDNTNTEGVHWNAATKRLGIGTVSADTALDVTGTITADGLTVDGATQIDATVTVGVDDTGYDVKFFGDTASAYMLWDASADDLILGGAAGLSVNSAATVGGTLGVTGVVTANAGVVVDNITIDGDTIALSSGTLVLDSASQLVIDVDGGIVQFKDAGTEWAQLKSDSTNVQLISIVLDKDIIFRGNDGGVFINALTLDMSAAGAATFNSSITIPDYIYHTSDANTYFGFPGGDEFELITAAQSRMKLVGSATTFNEGGNDKDFRVKSSGNANMLFVDGGNDRVAIGGTGYTNNTDLNLLGDGLSLYNNKAGSSNNWSLIQNTATSSSSNLLFTLGSGNIEFSHGGGLITNPTANYNTVFNEGGVDADFRVASDTNANALFVEGSSGNVGIGTASPNFTLQLDSQRADATFDANNLDTWADFKIQGQTASGNARGIYFDFDSDTGNDRGAGIVGISGDVTGGVGSLGFITTAGNTSAERMRIDSSGYVGIGTSSPSGNLEIATSASDTGVDLVLDGNKTSNGGIGSIIFNNNGDSVGMIRSNRASANDAADMLFYTQATGGSNTERMRITSTGDLSLTGGGGIIFTDAGGTGTATSNTLDDYEEGTWTPTVEGSATPGDQTYTTQVGFYEKIGRQVTIRGRLTIDAIGTLDGNVSLSGFPFTSSSTANSYGSIQFSLGGSLAITANANLSCLVAINATKGNIKVWGSVTGTTNLDDLELTAGADLIFSGTYQV
jgi:hypothetical protein